MLIVLAGPGQEVAFRVGARQPLGGCGVLNQIGIGQRRQPQVAIQPKRFLEGYQLPHRGHHARLGKEVSVGLAHTGGHSGGYA